MSWINLFNYTTCINDTRIVKPLSYFSPWFPYVYAICACISLFIVLFGILGNIFNFIVLHQLRSSLPYRLMQVINFFDTLRLISNGCDFCIHLLEAFGSSLSVSGVQFIAYFHGLVLICKHTGSNASIYVLAFLSLIQVWSVKRPMSHISHRPVYITAALLSFMQFLLCAPYGVLTTAFFCPDYGRFKFIFTRREVTTYRLYVESILHTFLPTVFCIAVSYSLIVEIRKANTFRADVTSASNSSPISVSRSVLKLNLIFLACNVPHMVYIALYINSLMNAGQGIGLEVKNMIVVFADGAACFNSAINFVIYYSTDNRFHKKFYKAVFNIDLDGIRSQSISQTSGKHQHTNVEMLGRTQSRKSTGKITPHVDANGKKTSETIS